MITGELKSKVDAIWDTFWSNGISNPLSVIEQFTYLVFLKLLDDRQIKDESIASLTGESVNNPIYPERFRRFRWSQFSDLDPENLYTRLATPDPELDNLSAFEYMKSIGKNGGVFSQYVKDATFMFSKEKAQAVDTIIQQIQGLPLENRDTMGDIYEYMLSKLASAGQNGQFRTPRHIIKLMVHLADLKPSDVVADPACGSAGFLVAVEEYIQDFHYDWFDDNTFLEHRNTDMFHGGEIDPTMIRIGAMNLQLHGIEAPTLVNWDSLSKQNEIEDVYTLILANPPFKGSLDYGQVEPSLLHTTKTKKTELLFLSLILRQLEIGGRGLVIVPDGVLFGSSKAHKSIRKTLIEEHQLKAIISMPSGVFKPYAGVSTAIMIFTKTGQGGTENIWFYDMKADGLSLDDKRNALIDDVLLDKCFSHPKEAIAEVGDKCDIPFILHDWLEVQALLSEPIVENGAFSDRTAKSFLVPKQEIIDNDYDLSINRYKEIIYEEIEYEAPAELIKQIKELDAKRKDAMANLEKMIQ